MNFCCRQSQEAAAAKMSSVLSIVQCTHWVLRVGYRIGLFSQNLILASFSTFSFCLDVSMCTLLRRTLALACSLAGKQRHGGEGCLTFVHCCRWCCWCINYPDHWHFHGYLHITWPPLGCITRWQWRIIAHLILTFCTGRLQRAK